MSQSPKARSRPGLPKKELLLSFEEGKYAFDSKALFDLMGPGVYLVHGIDGCLYVGSAINVLARISDPTHRSFRLALQEATPFFGIQVIIAKSEQHARQLEAMYISLHQPKYNIRGKADSDRTFAEHFREQAQEFSFAEIFREELARRLA